MPKYRQRQLPATSVAVVVALLSTRIAFAGEPLGIELNSAEPTEGKCRLTFVMTNPNEFPVNSLKADAALFGTDGVIKRRLVVEFGPLKPRKTSIRAFELNEGCESLGSLLINDVIACQPENAGDCLSRLELSSRASIRLFK